MYLQFTKKFPFAALKHFEWPVARRRIAEYADPGYRENAGTSDQEILAEPVRDRAGPAA
jgi:hypothetical protein